MTRTKRSAAQRARKIVGQILFWVLLVLTAALVLSALLGRMRDRPAFWFGYTVLFVQTESMEPTIAARSYILVRASDGENLAVGDIITYRCRDMSSGAYGRLITHRIEEITPHGYRTKGDHPLSVPDKQIVLAQDVVACGARPLAALTWFGRIYASPIGFFLLIAIFLAASALLYIPDMIAALHPPKDAHTARQQEIERRVEEEVRRLQQQDTEVRKGGKS